MAAFKALSDLVAATLEELTCPICLSVATDAAILSCGHMGCEEHIREWLARKPECPTCRAAVSDTIVKMHALDGVLSKLTELQAAVEKAHLNRALTRTTSTDVSAGGPAPDGIDHIEKMFRTHVSTALNTCSQYALELQLERDTGTKEADMKFDALRAAATAEAATGGSTDAARDAKIAAARVERDAAVAAANARYQASFEHLSKDVDAYLSEVAVPINLLPCNVTVLVPSIHVRFDVRVRPMDTIDGVILPALSRVVRESQGLDALEFGPDVAWKWERGGAVDPHSPLYHQCSNSRPDTSVPLVCTGAVRAYSARASRCLGDIWTAGMKEDYFWCTTCSLKWVCGSCAKACHSGHNIVPFLTQHVPTFACCYCKSRTSTCCLARKESAATSGSAAAP